MPPRYDALVQVCPLARSLSVVGDAWMLLVLRDLFNGKKRFNEILISLDGISPNVLSARLKALEEEQVVERVIYSDRPLRAEYLLTDKGRQLGPILSAMRAWGRRYPQPS